MHVKQMQTELMQLDFHLAVNAMGITCHINFEFQIQLGIDCIDPFGLEARLQKPDKRFESLDGGQPWQFLRFVFSRRMV